MTAAGDTVSLRLKLRYPDLDAFIERYAENVSSAGLFLRTKAPKPAGTRIRFELSLADETLALVGIGVVVAVRTETPEGMAVRFRELEGESRAVVDRIVAEHGNGSLAPTPLSLDLGGGGLPTLEAWGSAEWSTGDVARGKGDWSDALGGATWPPATPPGRAPDPTGAPSATAPAPERASSAAAPPSAAPEPPEPPEPISAAASRDAASDAEPPKKRIASIGLVPAGQLPPRREGQAEPSSSTPEPPARPEPVEAHEPTPASAGPWEAEPTTTFSEIPFDVDVVSSPGGPAAPDADAPLAASLPPFDFERTPDPEPPPARSDAHDVASAPADDVPTRDVDPDPPETAVPPSPAASTGLPVTTDHVPLARPEDAAPRDDEAPTGDLAPEPPDPAPQRAPSIQPIPKSALPSSTPPDAEPTATSAPPTAAPPVVEPEPAEAFEPIEAPDAPLEPEPPPQAAAPAEDFASPPPHPAEPAPAQGPPEPPAMALASPDVATEGTVEPERSSPTAPSASPIAPPAPATAASTVDEAPAPEAGPGARNVVERTTADVEAQSSSHDLPVEMALAIGIDLGTRWVRGGYIERGEMNWLTLGSSVPWSALVAARPDGTLVVGPRARRVADTNPDRAISPMEVLASVQDGSLPDGFPISGWGAEGGIVTLGEHRFEFYDVLLAFTRGVRETFVAELPRDDFKAFIAMPAALEPAVAGMLRSAVREAGFEQPDFQPVGESLVRAYGLDDRSVDDVLIVHVEDTHTLVAVAQRSGRHLTVTSSEVLREVSTRAIDDAAVELVLENLTEQHGEDHRDDPVAVTRIREALDFARNDLRRSPTIELRVTLSSSGGAAGVGVERTVQVSRSLLFSKTETLASTLHERILARLNDRQIEPGALGAVVVSGPGGSYPPFSQVVERLCDQPPLGSIPPPHALAVGLARWGRSQTQSDVAKRPDTLDASIGIELPGGRFRPLLPAGAQLPLRFKRQQPVRPHAGQIELRIHQGDSEYVKGCSYLGALVIGPIRDEDRGTIKIELDMEVDVEGVLQARIAEPSSGLRGQVVTATRQTSEERRKTLPPPPARPPLAAPTTAEPASEGGFLKRLFGRKG